jgi:archaellum component FlaG (FlaF/FlaG flagellin family)
MSDEKVILESGEVRRRFPWSGASMLVLSLLLTAAVASLIYITVSQSHLACQTKSDQTKGEELTANVNVNVDGKKKSEKVALDTGREVAFFTDADGSITAEDFKKGISVTKAGNSTTCYVIATGSDRTDENSVKSFIRGYDGQKEATTETKEQYEVSLLPGEIRDTSFLPEEMTDKCDSFHWVAVADKNEGFELHTPRREKRAICYRYSYKCYTIGSLRYCYHSFDFYIC